MSYVQTESNDLTSHAPTHTNIALSAQGKIHSLTEDIGNEKLQSLANSLGLAHNEAKRQLDTIESDTRLNEDMKQFLAGKYEEKYVPEFTRLAQAMNTEVERWEKSLEGGLYTNNISLSPSEQALLGFIAPKLEKEGLDYLRAVPTAHSVANALASYGLVKNSDGIKDYLNRTHSQPLLDQLDKVSQLKETLSSAVKTEHRIMDMRTPNKEKYEALKAKDSLQAFTKDFGMKF